MKVRIGAAQMKIVPLRVEENLKKAELSIKHAHKQNCDIICFPELFLTGPLGKENLKYAQEVPGPYTEKFCTFAKEYGIHIVMGTIIEKGGHDYYNTSTLIDNSGRFLGKHRKIKPWAAEKSYIKNGNKTSVFRTRFGKVGLIICWDLAFPEITKGMALKGAKMIFCPSFWVFGDKYGRLKSKRLIRKVPDIDAESIFVDACVQARAIENEIVFTYVNGCGEFTKKTFTDRLIGHTQIAIPFYGTVALASADEETLLIKEIDLGLTSLAEKVYEIKKDSNKQMMF